MKIKSIRLWIRLITLIFCVVLISVGYLVYQLTHQFYQIEQRKQEEHLLAIGRSLTHNQIIIEQLEKEETSAALQQLVGSVQKDFDLSFIAIMTPKSVRLSHPKESEIYQQFQGGDEAYTLRTGKASISTAKGTLGPSLRGFVPVKNSQGQLIGTIAVGLSLEAIQKQFQKIQQIIMGSLVICLIMSIVTASALAYSLKKSMLDMTGQDIKRLYEKYQAMFENVSNAIILTDKEDRIQFINPAGRKLINDISGQTVIDHQKLTDFFPTIFQEGQASVTPNYVQENDTDYLFSVIPIQTPKKSAESLIIIQNISELRALIGQLNNTSHYVSVIESQTHDFLNKLHIIYGLTDMQEYQKLRDYLIEILEPDQEFVNRVTRLIHNPIISVFLMQERLLFSEKNTSLKLEVYPGIPASTDYIQIQYWLQLTHKIHQFFLNKGHFEQLHVAIGYHQPFIESQYRTLWPENQSDALLTSLNLLASDVSIKASQSILDFTVAEGWLNLTLKTPYYIDVT